MFGMGDWAGMDGQATLRLSDHSVIAECRDAMAVLDDGDAGGGGMGVAGGAQRSCGRIPKAIVAGKEDRGGGG